MATIALPRPIPPHRPTASINVLTPPLSLEGLAVAQPNHAVPLPNKHIPVCPPGPARAEEPNTPPPSPGSDDDAQQASLLYPPDKYVCLESGTLSLYKIDAAGVSVAIEYISRQPLPEPAQVFPWLHGLHPHNHIQQAFFIARRRALRKTPCCLRGVALVKADGDLNVSRLKGALAPQEFLQPGSAGEFQDVDPREGFSVRNFQIQGAKSAMTSDIIVYGEDDVMVRKLGWDIAAAQHRWREKHESHGHNLPEYNTFICVSPFRAFEEKHGNIVAVDSRGRLTGRVVDFYHQERKEMYAMTKASEISHNVWMGPTPDPQTDDEHQYDVLIECSDLGRLNPAALQALAESQDDAVAPYFDFPSSGSILPPTWSQAEADGILETCKWMFHLAHGTYPVSEKADMDVDGDTNMSEESEPRIYNIRPRRILIHCADGYTESTMLGIAYYSYSTGKPVPDAWLKLHIEKKRNFFAYPTDVALLTAIAPRLLTESPVCGDRSLSDITAMIKDEPKWLPGLDGSFPSRVLEYMYLGNLGHANNPDLLRDLGIGQILSVGETAMWRDGELEEWGEENVCIVQGVQDNGIDPLTDEFERCLEFIGKPYLSCPYLELGELETDERA
jgi:dual specificity MAP kinase phosphatase